MTDAPRPSRRPSMVVSAFGAGLTLALALSGCGQAGGTSSQRSEVVPAVHLTVPTFRIVVPVAKTAAAARDPRYVGAGTRSVSITLSAVDAAAPPAGLVTNAITNVGSGSCTAGCTVSGPAVPAGSDRFSVTTFDASGAAGNAIAQTAQAQTFTVTAGTANGPFVITLSGIPKSFSFGALSAGAADATSSQALNIAVLDADGNVITGSYAHLVTLSDDDASGDVAHGTSLQLGRDAAATSVTLANDTDAAAVTFGYGGLAIAPPTLTLRAAGATASSRTFGVTLAPIVVSQAEIDLDAMSGPGSSASFTVSEAGWSDAPYRRGFTLGTPACTIGTAAATYALSTSDSLTWADTMPASAASGHCVVPLVDFTGSGHAAAMTLTATTGSFTVN